MFTVDDLTDQVRDQLQETNTKTVSDGTILAALNRGSSYAWSIYARHYPEPILVRTPVTLDADNSFAIPDDAFEQRMQKVDLIQSGITFELERINYRRTTRFRNNVVGTRPAYYAIVGRRVEVFPNPNPNDSFSFECYYVRRPDQLRLQQGQVSDLTPAVTGISDASIVVDSVGSALSTSGAYAKYVNFVDARTGEIRGSAEIKEINGTQIVFKQNPTRTTVQGHTISGDIPTDLEPDDFITDIRGSCVVFLQQPTTNFLIQYAVAEIRRALGYDTGAEQNVLKEFEKQVEHTWAGREASLRIKSTYRIWRK